MEALLQYLIKSAAVLALFFICFKTLLSNETFFTTKRVYLLVGVLSCLLLPFVVIANYVTIDPVPLDWNNLSLVSQTPQTTSLPTWDWRLDLAQTYCVGVLLMFVRLLYQAILLVA
jgi:bla regulator protein BlaR1|tara:strand:+ start:567 stop:914 length:348 start_codon:yes stop_codon:yes gene_type:complete